MLDWRENFKSKKLNEKEELIKLRKINNEFYWGTRKLGEIHKDRFVTHRKEGHMYIKQRSFNFNAELIDKYLIPLKIKTVILIYHKKEGGETLYKTTPKIIQEKGILSKESIFEWQYALSINTFN